VKVLLVTTIERGGPVEHARLLARDLVAAGAVVRVVAASTGAAEAFARAGSDPVVVRSRSPWDAMSARRVRRLGRDVDVVHSHDRRSGLWCLAGRRPGPGTARVHTLHGLPDVLVPLPGAPAGTLRRHRLAYGTVEGRLVGRADVLIVPSRALLRRATDAGYRTTLATIIPNGVDVDRHAGGGAEVGMLTALERVKGVEVFIRAASLLHRDDPSSRFVVFGDGSERDELQAMATQAGLDGVMRFPGHVPAAVALAELRVLVVSSHFENSPMAVLEAMAARVPVVATRVGGIPEMAPPDTLVTVPPDDPAALAEAVRRTVSDEAGTTARIGRAREHIEAHRSAPATAAAVEAAYRDALDRSAR